MPLEGRETLGRLMGPGRPPRGYAGARRRGVASVGVTAKVGPGVQDLNGCDIGHGYAYFCSRFLRTSISRLSGEVPTTQG